MTDLGQRSAVCFLLFKGCSIQIVRLNISVYFSYAVRVVDGTDDVKLGGGSSRHGSHLSLSKNGFHWLIRVRSWHTGLLMGMRDDT